MRTLNGTLDAAERKMDSSTLREHVAQLYPGHRVLDVVPLTPDRAPSGDPSAKAAGYAQPRRVTLSAPGGETVELVWRVAMPDELGHDRRSDRAAEILLAYEDFASVPRHVMPVDVGAVRRDGTLLSLRDYEELYLLTRYAPGTPYAEDLRRIARAGAATTSDLDRVTTLAGYLAALHQPVAAPVRYRRAIRDLVGSGEGIFGVIDSYPHGVPGASRNRLVSIEQRCAEWRWRLHEHEGRLARIHGDFHPFNILFEGEQLVLLDASRGACGDPADDVTALAINYILFALDTDDGWSGLGSLWHRLWASYAELHKDSCLRAVAPPFFAWRALVVCNPRFYPNLSGTSRSALLALAETALDSLYLDPASAEELFR